MSENCVTLVPSAHSNLIFFKVTLASCHLKSLRVALFTSNTLISSPVQNVTGKWPCFSLRQQRCVSDSGEIFRENYHYEISAFPSVLQTSPTLPQITADITISRPLAPRIIHCSSHILYTPISTPTIPLTTLSRHTIPPALCERCIYTMHTVTGEVF